MVTKVAIVTSFVPILKLENGAFTRDEWECILHHSFFRNLEDKLALQVEHLSANRLRQSLTVGLEKINCVDLRADIW